MKTAAALLITIIASTTVHAQQIPSEETKIWALKRAYEINGNSMVRAPELGSIDVSEELAGLANPKEKNLLDDKADKTDKPVEKKKKR